MMIDKRGEPLDARTLDEMFGEQPNPTLKLLTEARELLGLGPDEDGFPPDLARRVRESAPRDPGLWLGNEKVLPAADPEALDEGLRLEVEYERAKEAAIDKAREALAIIAAEGYAVGAVLRPVREAIEAYDTAREAYRAHGGSVWHPVEGWKG